MALNHRRDDCVITWIESNETSVCHDSPDWHSFVDTAVMASSPNAVVMLGLLGPRDARVGGVVVDSSRVPSPDSIAHAAEGLHRTPTLRNSRSPSQPISSANHESEKPSWCSSRTLGETMVVLSSPATFTIETHALERTGVCCWRVARCFWAGWCERRGCACACASSARRYSSRRERPEGVGWRLLQRGVVAGVRRPVVWRGWASCSPLELDSDSDSMNGRALGGRMERRRIDGLRDWSGVWWRDDGGVAKDVLS